MIKNKKFAGIVMLLLVATVLVSGCAQEPAKPGATGTASPSPTGPTEVKSEKDVAKVVGDVSTDVSKLSKELATIDNDLG